MTPAQRALILAALGLLSPKGRRMPRWSSRNEMEVMLQTPIVQGMIDARWIYPLSVGHMDFRFRVTRLGAEAAGVLGRCRREDVRR